MFKQSKIYWLLIVSVVLVFTECTREEYIKIPANERILYNEGDTLIFNNRNTRDSFVVSEVHYTFFPARTEPCYLEVGEVTINKLSFSISELQNLKDIIILNKTGYITVRFCHYDGNQILFSSDSIYDKFFLFNREYSHVFYSAKENSYKPNELYKNIYYNYQYGVICFKVNGSFIWLSEIKPPR